MKGDNQPTTTATITTFCCKNKKIYIIKHVTVVRIGSKEWTRERKMNSYSM